MMSQPGAASDFFEKLRRIPFSVWVLFISLASGGVGYGLLHNYQQREKPVPQTARLVEGLNRYYRQERSFPPSLETLLDINGWREWKKIGQKTWHCRQYHYCYHFIDQQRIVVWAIPVGRYRDQGENYLIMGRSGNYEIWKGPILDRSESERLMDISLPTYRQLNLYGLQRVYSSQTAEATAR